MMYLEHTTEFVLSSFTEREQSNMTVQTKCFVRCFFLFQVFFLTLDSIRYMQTEAMRMKLAQ